MNNSKNTQNEIYVMSIKKIDNWKSYTQMQFIFVWLVKFLTYGQKTKKTPCNSYNSLTIENQHMFIKIKMKLLKNSIDWYITILEFTGQIQKYNWSKLKNNVFFNFWWSKREKKNMLFIIKLKLSKRAFLWCITILYFTGQI